MRLCRSHKTPAIATGFRDGQLKTSCLGENSLYLVINFEDSKP